MYSNGAWISTNPVPMICIIEGESDNSSIPGLTHKKYAIFSTNAAIHATNIAFGLLSLLFLIIKSTVNSPMAIPDIAMNVMANNQYSFKLVKQIFQNTTFH
jgi:hypothetical protein|tara:strand:- start:254649 stop:254951 length:303 start_codon:yes stop_codon:yes gene_type:complete